ncbi:hypothetical protein MNB_SM-7-325 [hydrothermal vent metagenome]|uniref:Uncharacterized protein n=1 Tax=hydrothermal vent metagenome TaxID=652676 RepID=A0A1W1BDL7_9ZZZZ
MSDALQRLKELTSKISSYELTRKENLKRLRELFVLLELDKKIDSFETIFLYKAINLSAVSLQKESFGEIQKGKYLQILAITKIDGKSKNISLGYFGRVENVPKKQLDEVMEFVIRYRFEKSFLTLEHYHQLLENFKG